MDFKKRQGIKFGLLASLLLSVFSLSAQNVLFASTKETSSGGIVSTNNLYNQFTALGGATVTDQRETLGQIATLPMPSFAGYDLVVVTAAIYGLEADEQTALITAINSKASGAFILIFDGCCGNGGASTHNADATINVLNSTFSPTPSPPISRGPYITSAATFNLETSSPYAHSFTGLPAINGTHYTSSNNVPTENILYKDGAGRTTAVFLPQADTGGACVFSLMDISPFTSAYNSGNSAFAQTVSDAILDPTGSCHRSSSGNAVVAEDDSYTTKPALIIEKDTSANSVVVLDNDSELLSEGLLIEASGTDTTSANGGTVAITGSTLNYTPATGFEGVDTFTYEVCVPSGACDTALVTILVVAPPFAVYDNSETAPETAVTIAVLDNDIISATTPASINSFTQASNGVVTQSGDSFIYTPNTGFVGIDSFTYTICDTNNICSTATVTINIARSTSIIAPAARIPSVSWLGLLLLLGSLSGLMWLRKR